MKKSLLAVAAIGAFASAAQAQSSVTVYGILDVGYAGSNQSVSNRVNATGAGAAASSSYAATNGVVGGTTGNANAQTGVLKSTYSGLGQSAQSTSRLGFKGNEDLGGGTSAFFTAEFGLNPQEQDLSGNTNGGLRNRQTFVGLKKNGLGDAAIGTQYTPIHGAVAKTDPGMQNNQTGSVIYTGQGDGYNIQGAAGGNAGAYQTRYSNSITFNSQVVAGFQGHLMGVLNNQNQTVTTVNATNGNTAAGGRFNTTGWVAGADYTWQKAFVTANYSAMKNISDSTACPTPTVNAAQPAAAGACGFAVFGQASAVGVPNAASVGRSGAVGTQAGNPMNVVDVTQYYAATYDFGILKAYANYINRKAYEQTDASIYTSRTAQQIGVNSYVTPTIQTWASIGTGKFTPLGTAQPGAGFSAWQLGSNYYLSKRTNLYAIYGQYSQGASNYSSTLNAAGANLNNNSFSLNSNSYAVGVRHTF
jgi:predicted porin